ncbi:MAG: acyl-CoA dehydrogenase family protein, partial [Proteobacteria bacterium]|nr:acyl-CoA dehydrogenase family protein [Pseudomonadota bacterium]
VHWPVQFGGLAATPIQQYLFELECALAGAPMQLAFGLRMLGPVLMRYGSPAQQQRFLPRILSGEDWWCQGYSEPGAGSDLASLKTQAALVGDAYVVNGQKCWNTLGQHADWIFCLVRTDASVKPQRGISMLLIDMKSPGITVRPTVLLDGTAEVNEIWFQDVRVPVTNRVGEENQGWTYAKFLLGHERANIAGIGTSKRELLRLKSLAARNRRGGRAVIDDPDFRRRLARVEIDLLALEYTNLRMLSAPASSPSAGIAASILKIRGSEIRQALSELLVEASGTAALRVAGRAGDAWDGAEAAGLTAAYLNLRKLSIFGGSNEIQKNIISQTLIGL